MQFYNYFITFGWMHSCLHLKGNELIAFSIIYGFSQDGMSGRFCDAVSLADWIGCSERGAIDAVKRLIDAGWVVRNERHELVYNQTTINPILRMGEMLIEKGETTANFAVQNAKNAVKTANFAPTPYNKDKINSKEINKESYERRPTSRTSRDAQRADILSHFVQCPPKP